MWRTEFFPTQIYAFVRSGLGTGLQEVRRACIPCIGINADQIRQDDRFLFNLDQHMALCGCTATGGQRRCAIIHRRVPAREDHSAFLGSAVSIMFTTSRFLTRPFGPP